MSTDSHPRETTGCADCGAPPRWSAERQLPQVGQTYTCERCGHEVYVYDSGDHGETRRQWRPVTDGLVANLQFYAVVGDWPDAVLADLFRRGLERYEAIDYHAVETEGLTQTAWADKRGVGQAVVSQNVAKAHTKLDDD